MVILSKSKSCKLTLVIRRGETGELGWGDWHILLPNWVCFPEKPKSALLGVEEGKQWMLTRNDDSVVRQIYV